MPGRGKIQIFSGRSAEDYSLDVLHNLRGLNEYTSKFVDLNGEKNVKCFSDGEIEIEILSSVRKKDIYVIQRTSNRNVNNLSTHENKIELFHLIDSLKRSHAGSITVIEPFISCSRSDRAYARNSSGLAIHFKTLVSIGANHVITYQLHSEKSKMMIDPVYAYIDDVPLYPQIQKYIFKEFVKTREYLHNEVHKNWAICSVDAGGEKVARAFADIFGCQLIIANKRRSYSRVNTIEGVSLLTDEPIENKTIWVIDDMIDTAGSILELVKALKARNPKEINIAIAHPVFSGPGVSRMIEMHELGYIQTLLVCDTIWISDQMKNEMPFMKIISTAPITADIIYKTNIGESLSIYFDPINPYHVLPY
ncbi:MAG: ribose-phosphate pyrophosphokinase [Spirochaetales bacterium]|nr:ribose-phosphate pyrophosphokinase [Spirochaetales bacterium]